MNIRINIFLVLVTFKIASCSWITGDFYTKYNIPETSGREIFDGEVEPLRPPLKEGMEGVFGIDANNNGVRDDVEIWINRKFDDPLRRKAYKEKYRFTVYKMKLALAERREELETLVDEYELFFGVCLFPRYEMLEMHQRKKDLEVFHNIVINTSLRKQAYSKYIMLNRNIGGQIDKKKDLEYLEEKCPFTEKERENALKKYLEHYKD